MRRIVRKKQRRAGGNRAKSAFQNECQYALETDNLFSRSIPVSRKIQTLRKRLIFSLKYARLLKILTFY